MRGLLRRAIRTLDTQSAYTKWAENYPPQAHNALMEVEQDALLSLLPDVCGKQVLDLGCGSGRYTRVLRESGAAFAFGVDLSHAMLLAGHVVHAGQVAQADWLAIPFPANTFDVIISGLTISHVLDLNAALAEAARVLKVDGALLYSSFHPLGHFLGWQRTFQSSDGETFAVESYAHLIADHFAAAQAAQLRFVALQEPRLKQGEAPVALVARLEKIIVGNE